MHRIAPWLAVLLALVISQPSVAHAQESDEIVIREAPLIGSLGRGGRNPFQTDTLIETIAPSAGWVSFWSYTGACEYENATEIEQIVRRAATPSDALALSRNYLHSDIYILHGIEDDNVPVTQARTMRSHLSSYHSDFAYFEQPGAGHW